MIILYFVNVALDNKCGTIPGTWVLLCESFARQILKPAHNSNKFTSVFVSKVETDFFGFFYYFIILFSFLALKHSQSLFAFNY